MDLNISSGDGGYVDGYGNGTDNLPGEVAALLTEVRHIKTCVQKLLSYKRRIPS